MQLSIRSKLIGGFCLVVLLALIALGILYMQISSLSLAMNQMVNQQMNVLVLTNQIRYQDLYLTDMVRGILINPKNQGERAQYNQVGEELDKNFELVQQLDKSDNSRKVFDRLDHINIQLMEIEAKVIELADSDPDLAKQYFSGEYTSLRQEFKTILDEYVNGVEKDINLASQHSLASAEQSKMIGMIMGIITLLASILVAFFLIRNIVRGINRPVMLMQELAKQGGDLTRRLEVSSGDEMQELADATNAMLDNLNQIVTEVKEISIQLSSASYELASSAEQLGRGVQEIAAGAEELASGADEQNNHAKNIFRVIKSTVDATKEISVSSQEVTDAALGASEQSRQGSDAMQQAILEMERMNESTQEISALINRLGERSQAIGQIVELISNIASQTNLLALNAAIEAARAGEQGRGFAVVADEVRKLAEESGRAVDDISSLLGEIISGIHQAVDRMEANEEIVASGTETIKKGAEAFGIIKDATEQVAEQAARTSDTIKELADNGLEVMEAAQKIADITEQVAAASEEMAAGTEEQMASTEEVASSAENLATLGNNLKTAVGRFIV